MQSFRQYQYCAGFVFFFLIVTVGKNKFFKPKASLHGLKNDLSWIAPKCGVRFYSKRDILAMWRIYQSSSLIVFNLAFLFHQLLLQGGRKWRGWPNLIIFILLASKQYQNMEPRCSRDWVAKNSGSSLRGKMGTSKVGWGNEETATPRSQLAWQRSQTNNLGCTALQV